MLNIFPLSVMPDVPEGAALYVFSWPFSDRDPDVCEWGFFVFEDGFSLVSPFDGSLISDLPSAIAEALYFQLGIFVHPSLIYYCPAYLDDQEDS